LAVLCGNRNLGNLQFHSLTLWNGVCLEKPIVAHLIMKFPTSDGCILKVHYFGHHELATGLYPEPVESISHSHTLCLIYNGLHSQMLIF